MFRLGSALWSNKATLEGLINITHNPSGSDYGASMSSRIEKCSTLIRIISVPLMHISQDN